MLRYTFFSAADPSDSVSMIVYYQIGAAGVQDWTLNPNQVILYPNPASDYLFIDYDIIFVKEAKLQIYNSIGAIVYTKILDEKQDNFKISVSEYKNGLYFCSLQIDGKLLNTKKILINHH